MAYILLFMFLVKRKEVFVMKRLLKNLERLIMAATYAEAGAFDLAREVLQKEKDKGKRSLVFERRFSGQIASEVQRTK